MKRLILLFLSVFFLSSVGFTQSVALQNQMNVDKKEMASYAYSLLHSGQGESNKDWVLNYDFHNFTANYTYHAIAYIEDCSSCDIGMYFHNKTTDRIVYLEPEQERSGDIVRATLNTKETTDTYGDLAVYSDSRKKRITYILLFSKYNP